MTNRGIIIRQRVNDISIQSRPATGVRLQKLDDEDAIAAVALVPPALQEDEDEDDDSDPAESVEAEIAAAEAAEEVIDAAASDESPLR
jgi:DNA gyrase subunit A